jgi:hypothetical protein
MTHCAACDRRPACLHTGDGIYPKAGGELRDPIRDIHKI